MRNYIGTSGWNYYNWQGLFYPDNIKRSTWLEYFSIKLNSVEINSTFYHMPRNSTIVNWNKATQDGFIFSIKASRIITHYKKLVDCAENIEILISRLNSLGNKCGPILFQLPASFKKDITTLKTFISQLPKHHRYTFEFRDHSWHDDETYDLLAKENVAFCIYEIAGNISPRITTTDFNYVRLHGKTERYKGLYSLQDLEILARWLIDAKADSYVYFDNTMLNDDAIQNALQLRKLLNS